jgi:hypothetical protein
VFQALKENNFNSRMFFPEKLPSKIEGRIKNLPV